MSTNQQRIHCLKIKQLKSLKDVEISFEEKAVTAILGPNGNGKSTILHALACCYKPINQEITTNYKFSDFFLPNPDAQWQGSELTLFHTYRNDKDVVKDERVYAKNSDRWTPRYSRRPERHVYYLGIDKCVPLIESEKQQTRVNYITTPLADHLTETLLTKASYIFNKTYTALNQHNAGKGKTYIGVESNGTRYSALSMSAGEQKVFLLLETIFKADKYSLILIDEIDLLLHDCAVQRLLEVAVTRANDKHLQIVFTTHRESILELSSLLNVRHIFNTTSKTLCFNETKPDAIHRLTGKQQRDIEVFVEDDLAVAIVKKIVSNLKIQRYVDIKQFGAAANCFTIISGFLLTGENCNNKLFILDGDVFNSLFEKQNQINKVLTGNGEDIKTLKNDALQHIKQLIIPENTKPEKYLHSLIIKMNDSDNEEFNEIIEVAKSISVVDDSHRYISYIIARLNYERSVGLAKIIDLISTHPEWKNYISEVYEWLSPKVEQLRENAV
jgi:Fe-S cluster assembly ATPase SufC